MGVIDFAGLDQFANSLGSWERSVRMEKGLARRKQVQGRDITHQQHHVKTHAILKMSM